MATLPHGFAELLDDTFELARQADACLSQLEMEFLALLAACPTATGVTLAMGDCRRANAIILARSMRAAGCEGKLVLCGASHAESETADNLPAQWIDAEIAALVEVDRRPPRELMGTWDRPIRLLWIDGDHPYRHIQSTVESCSPHLADGAIIALHQVLEGRDATRVFCDFLQQPDHIGPAGLCESIGWAQFFGSSERCRPYQAQKRRLHHRLSSLLADGSSSNWQKSMTGLRRRLYRAGMAQWRVHATSFLRNVA